MVSITFITERIGGEIMQKNGMLCFAIICLSVSIVISASIISKGIKENGSSIHSGLNNVSAGLRDIGSSINNIDNNNVVRGRSTLKLNSAATYLGVSDVTLKEIINSKDSGIPYINTGADYIFSKAALDKWLETTRFDLKK